MVVARAPVEEVAHHQQGSTRGDRGGEPCEQGRPVGSPRVQLVGGDQVEGPRGRRPVVQVDRQPLDPVGRSAGPPRRGGAPGRRVRSPPPSRASPAPPATGRRHPPRSRRPAPCRAAGSRPRRGAGGSGRRSRRPEPSGRARRRTRGRRPSRRQGAPPGHCPPGVLGDRIGAPPCRPLWRLLVGPRDFVLTAGEAVGFNSRVPHALWDPFPEPAEALSRFGPQGERTHPPWTPASTLGSVHLTAPGGRLCGRPPRCLRWPGRRTRHDV